MSETTTFDVLGMTCDHCVAAVTSEISAIGGVTDVSVDLASGKVDVTSDVPVDPTSVKAAVDEAGYKVVS